MKDTEMWLMELGVRVAGYQMVSEWVSWEAAWAQAERLGVRTWTVSEGEYDV